MQILQITDFYPPVIGGSERHVQALSQELVRLGHQVTVATLSGGRECERDDDGVSVRKVSGIARVLRPFYQRVDRPFHPPVPDIGVMHQLAALIAEIRPQVVNAQGWIMYSYLPLRRRLGVPVVATLHDYGTVCAKKSLLYRGSPCSGAQFRKCVGCANDHYGVFKGTTLTAGLALSAPWHKHVDRFIAVSHAVARAVEAATEGVPVEVIPSFVADDALAVADHAARPQFAPEGPYVLCVGSWGPHKGIDVLLRAYGELRARQGVSLLILAAGNAGPHLGTLPDDVTVVRDVAHSQVMAACAHASVCVVPSVWSEPFGQVAVEAMAAGRPVVASGIGGLRDILTEEVGVLVPPGDEHALAGAIEDLLLDPIRSATLGAAGRLRAKRYTASHVARRMESLFRELARGQAC